MDAAQGRVIDPRGRLYRGNYDIDGTQGVQDQDPLRSLFAVDYTRMELDE